MLDSNELISVLDLPTVAKRLTTWLSGRPATLFVPMMVIAECFPPHVSEQRITNLVSLAREVFPQIRTASGLIPAIKAEQSQTQPGVVLGEVSLGALSPKTAPQWTKLATAFAEAFLSTQQIKTKQFMNERALPGKNPGVDNAVIAALLESTDGQLPVSFVRSALVDEVPMLQSEADVLATPKRFPVLTLFAHLLFRHAWANMAAISGGQPREHDRVIGLFRTKSKAKGGMGAWADIEITAVSAQADILVTSDGALRDRCQFLRELGLLRFRACSLQALLSES